MPLPKRYVERPRGAGRQARRRAPTGSAARTPSTPTSSSPRSPSTRESFLDVYTEAVVTPDDSARWLARSRGAIVGDVLASKLGVKVGDKVTLTGTIYPGDWEFNIDGIYQATRKSIDRSQFLFHWDYLNESVPERRKDQVGWIISRIDHPESAANITAAIDKIFDEKDVQTLHERARDAELVHGDVLRGPQGARHRLDGHPAHHA